MGVAGHHYSFSRTQQHLRVAELAAQAMLAQHQLGHHGCCQGWYSLPWRLASQVDCLTRCSHMRTHKAQSHNQTFFKNASSQEAWNMLWQAASDPL